MPGKILLESEVIEIPPEKVKLAKGLRLSESFKVRLILKEYSDKRLKDPFKGYLLYLFGGLPGNSRTYRLGETIRKESLQLMKDMYSKKRNALKNGNYEFLTGLRWEPRFFKL